MAGSTVASLNALMGEVFTKNVVKALHTERILMMMFEKVTPEEINERGARIPIFTSRAPSFQGGTEGAAFPQPTTPGYQYWTPSLRSVYSTGGFSGYAKWQSGVNDVNSQNTTSLRVRNMLGQQVQDHFNSFRFFLDQATFRDGNGKLSDAITAVTTGVGGSFTVAPGNANWTVDDIPVGATINFYDSTGTLHNTGAAQSVVTAVNETTGVVTCDNVPTNAAVGDFPVWSGSWNLLPQGLAGLIQDQNITFQGVNVTNFPMLKGNTLNASAAFDIKFVNRMQTRAQKRLGTTFPRNDYVVICHPKQLDAYRNAGYALNTILTNDANRNSKTLDLAYSMVEISGMPIYTSNNCGERDMFGIRLNAFKRYSLFEPNLLPCNDEGQYLIMTPTATGGYKHEYQFYFAFYGNLLVTLPAANWRIYNLDKTNLG